MPTAVEALAHANNAPEHEAITPFHIAFPVDDLDHMSLDGSIVMTCEFCNHDFRFRRDTIRGAVDGTPD